MKKLIRRGISSHRIFAVAWFIAITLQGVLLVHFLQGRPALFTTDLFALLPPDNTDPIVAKLSEKIAKQLENQITVAFEGESREALSRAADAFESSFSAASSRIIVPRRENSELFNLIRDMYVESTKSLLTKVEIHALSQPDGPLRLINGSKALLYSPAFNSSGLSLTRDPLLLLPRFLSRLSLIVPRTDGSGRLIVKDGGRDLIVSHLSIDGSPFSSEVQNEVHDAYLEASATVARDFPEVIVSRAGLIWIARETGMRITDEVTILNLVAMIGSFGLFWIVFRSFGALLLTLIPLAVGALSGLVATLIFFPTVHAVTIGFGSVLIGGCTDYGVHYLSSFITHASRGEDRFKALEEVFSGLTLGVLTSIIAFAAFLFAPLPALLQIAIFASSGLLGAYLSVVLFFPVLSRRFISGHSRKAYSLPSVSNAFRAFKRLSFRTKLLTALPTILLVLFGASRLRFDDDVRLLTKIDPSLLANEQRIQRLVKGWDPGRFVLIEGSSEGEVLNREAAVRTALVDARLEGSLLGITSFAVSPDQAAESAEGLQQFCSRERVRLIEYASDIGLPFESIEDFCGSANNYNPSHLIERLTKSPLRALMALIWLGKTERGFASTLRLSGSAGALTVLDEVSRIPGVTYVDRVANASQVLSLYRVRASLITLLAYALIFSVLAIRYGVRRTVRLMLAPALGAFAALACLGYVGGSVNVFSVLGILVTLGLGVDFTLFIEESNEHREAAELGVVTSALTSILSFGCLAFTSMPILNQFGISISVGIFVAMLVAPLSAAER